MFFKGILFLLKFCWNSKKSYILFMIITQFVDAILPLVLVVLPKLLIDELMNQQRIEYLIMVLGGAGIVLLIGNLLSNFLHTQAFILKGDIFVDFRIMLSEKLAKADYESLENPEFLNTKERAYKFLYGDGQGFASVLDNFFNIISKILNFIGVIFILSTLNILVVILFIVIVLINSFVDARYKKKNVKLDLEKAPYERKIFYFSDILDNFQYGKEMRIGNLKDWIMGKYKNHINITQEFYKKSIKNNRKALFFSSLVQFLQQTASYVYLIVNVVNNQIGLGDFTMYFNSINLFNSSMQQVMNSIIEISRYAQYYEAVEKYMNIPTILREGKNQTLVDSISYNIKFENVCFKYAGQESYALKNINLEIKSNEKIALVGENGAGKTTLVKLLIRLYNPTKGRITINGKDIRDIDYDQYMSLFSVVFQDYKLFSFSIKENIELSNNQPNNDIDIANVLEKSGIKTKIDSLDKGIYTSIYKNFDQTGFEPSGGEGQKIALARAIYKDASFVVLDEPTAALDPRAESEMFRKFNELVENKTAVYITHRLVSVAFCDKIIVLNKGEIIESGDHGKLIDNNNLYAELYNMQAEFYER